MIALDAEDRDQRRAEVPDALEHAVEGCLVDDRVADDGRSVGLEVTVSPSHEAPCLGIVGDKRRRLTAFASEASAGPYRRAATDSVVGAGAFTISKWTCAGSVAAARMRRTMP